jgi:dCMP deaminase
LVTGADGRPTWDAYFLTIADAVAQRSTCLRRSVGAVLVRDRRILATGFNGAVRGQPHCLDVGCDLVDGHCVRAVHAEMNAVVQAALHGVSTAGSVLYCTSQPCHNCTKVLLNAGVVGVVYRDPYEDARAAALWAAAGVTPRRLAPAPDGAGGGSGGS